MRSYFRKCWPLLLVWCFSVQAGNNKINQLTDFLEAQHITAKEYIINLFEEKDIIILYERHHAETEQYNLFMEIISDPAFIENVGVAYTEVGGYNRSRQVNEFLVKEGLDSITIHKEVTGLLRNADMSANVWFAHSYPWFLQEIYKLNQRLNKEDKIEMYGCDASFDWDECFSQEEYFKLDSILDEDRDSIMANNFAQQFKIQPLRNGKRKALIIQNTRHAYLKDTHGNDGMIRKNTGRYIYDLFGDKVASVFITGLGYPDSWNEYTVIKDGLWDAAFESAGKTDVGFTLQDTPFGKAPFDLTPVGWTIDKYLYQDIFTGIIYYKPIEQHLLKTGWEGTFTEDFRPELMRRFKIADGEETEITPEDIHFLNSVTTSKYHNLEELRAKIDKWKPKY